MPEAVAPPREAYFVVVSGSMNPAIHSPQWYRVIGAIDEAELQASLASPSISTTSFSSHVEFGSPLLSITCQSETWWVQSGDKNSWPRMLEITSLVFDRLKETPLKTFGLVVQRHIETEASDIKSVLASSLADLNLGLPSGKSTGSVMSVSVVQEDHEVTSSIQPSHLSERSVFIQYQHQYEVPKAPSGYVDLRVLLKSRSEQFRLRSEKAFTEIVSSVNARVKGTSNG